MLSQKNILVKRSWIMAVFLGILVAACSKMDGTYKEFLAGGEMRYSQKPDTLGINPGHHRVRAWIAAKRSNLSKFQVFWNNRADSVEVPIAGTTGNDTLSVIIDNLAEGSYTFEFFTFDKEGNKSIVIDTIGNVYGDEYISSMSNRLIASSTFGRKVKISWYNAGAGVIRTEVRYKSLDGTPHLVKVKANEKRTVIDDEPQEGSMEYRTVFLPHPNAIDTFYTDYAPITLTPPVEEPYDGFPETFEDYTQGTLSGVFDIEMSSGEWRLNNFAIGKNNAADRKNGTSALRSYAKAECVFEMLYDVPNGATKISFYHGICSSDGSSQFRVEASQDQGATWHDISNGGFTNSVADKVYREILLDIEGSVRFRFFKLATPNCPTSACRMNLDDITIYNITDE